MSDTGNYLGAVLFGTISAINGYIALEHLLIYTNVKAVALENSLANASGITEQVYKTANQAAEKLSSEDFYYGLFIAGIAGFTAGLAIYHACRKKE